MSEWAIHQRKQRGHELPALAPPPLAFATIVRYVADAVHVAEVLAQATHKLACYGDVKTPVVAVIGLVTSDHKTPWISAVDSLEAIEGFQERRCCPELTYRRQPM